MQKKRDNISIFLDDLQFMKNLNKDAKSEIADSLKDTWYAPGETVIKSNDKKGDKFIMIMEGECQAKKVLKKGDAAKSVKKFKSGDYVAGRELLRDVPLDTTVVAETYVYAVCMDKQTFTKFMQQSQKKLERKENEYAKALVDGKGKK